MTTATINASPIPQENLTAPADDEIMSEMVEAGKTALNNGDVRGALEHFEKASSHFPDRPEGHNNLGAMYSSLGEFKKAERCFDSVLELLPHNPNVLFNRGIVRSQQEKFDLAREDFLASTKITPDDPEGHNNLGFTTFMQGQLKVARKHFKKALKLNPSYANALLNLCDVEESEGNFSLAIELCETFLAGNHSLEVRRRHLDLLSRNCQMNLDRASQVAETLLVCNAEDTETRMQLGKLTQAKAALLDGPTF